MKNDLVVVNTNERLRSVLTLDKQSNPLKIINVLKSEILYVLKNYMEISAPDLYLNIYVDDNGLYVLDIGAKVRRLKMASSFNDKYED